jgi:3'-5' exoribonuclease
VKAPFVADLQPEQNIHTVFLVVAKDVRQKKSGDPFFSLILADKTGELDAKMWDNVADIAGTFERDDFIKVKGLVQVFQNKLQLTIHKLQPVPEAEVELADFFPTSARDPEEMFRELHGHIAAIANPHLQALLQAFFADEEISRLYRRAPAAKSIHHAWFSGLLEHVLSMAALAKVAGPHYGVDMDLLMTGVILHDIGKIHELTYERTFHYSDAGQLVGHIVMAIKMLDEKIRLVPGFPPELRLLVEHLILSHHGTLEYGSPKTPVFAEALLLHHLDNMDSKMEAMQTALRKDARVDGHWTGYVPSLERSVFKKDRFLQPASTAAPAVVQPAESKPEPKPAAPTPSARSNSEFASKLQGALKP